MSDILTNKDIIKLQFLEKLFNSKEFDINFLKYEGDFKWNPVGHFCERKEIDSTLITLSDTQKIRVIGRLHPNLERYIYLYLISFTIETYFRKDELINLSTIAVDREKVSAFLLSNNYPWCELWIDYYCKKKTPLYYNYWFQAEFYIFRKKIIIYNDNRELINYFHHPNINMYAYLRSFNHFVDSIHLFAKRILEAESAKRADKERSY